MKTGDVRIVDGHRVEKVTDVLWAVRDPLGEWYEVIEDAAGYGWIGYPPACELVALAEQGADFAAAVPAGW